MTQSALRILTPDTRRLTTCAEGLQVKSIVRPVSEIFHMLRGIMSYHPFLELDHIREPLAEVWTIETAMYKVPALLPVLHIASACATRMIERACEYFIKGSEDANLRTRGAPHPYLSAVLSVASRLNISRIAMNCDGATVSAHHRTPTL